MRFRSIVTPGLRTGPRAATWCCGVAVAVAAWAGDDAPPRPTDATLGLRPPAGAAVLLGSGLDAWSQAGDRARAAGWPVVGEVATVGPGNIRSRQLFGDFRLHVEFSVPFLPDKKEQARGNSGVYLQGIYELQVLDSYGLVPKNNDCGAIYQQIAPSVNACKPPLQWQTYDVTFRAARLEGGRVVQKARITVVQNGLTIIANEEIAPTPGGVGDVKEGGPGPILLQDHGDAVQYRNIWVVPLAS